MKNFIIIIFISFLCFSIFNLSAYALGIGAYGDAGIKSTYWNEGAGQVSGYVRYTNSLDYFYGGGIVLDTAVARDTLFG